MVAETNVQERQRTAFNRVFYGIGRMERLDVVAGTHIHGSTPDDAISIDFRMEEDKFHTNRFKLSFKKNDTASKEKYSLDIKEGARIIVEYRDDEVAWKGHFGFGITFNYSPDIPYAVKTIKGDESLASEDQMDLTLAKKIEFALAEATRVITDVQAGRLQLKARSGIRRNRNTASAIESPVFGEAAPMEEVAASPETLKEPTITSTEIDRVILVMQAGFQQQKGFPLGALSMLLLKEYFGTNVQYMSQDRELRNALKRFQELAKQHLPKEDTDLSMKSCSIKEQDQRQQEKLIGAMEKFASLVQDTHAVDMLTNYSSETEFRAAAQELLAKLVRYIQKTTN